MSFDAALSHLKQLQEKNVSWVGENQELVEDYNLLVKECESARYELIVHRQSVGFTIRNQELVHSLYKVPPYFSV